MTGLLLSTLLTFAYLPSAQATEVFEFSAAQISYGDQITEDDVIATQDTWGAGIVQIGKVFQSGGDYRKAANDHIAAMYDYDEGIVMFKPTLTRGATTFRPNFEGALSYFVGGNRAYQGDKGFAIAPWTNVRFDNHMIRLQGNTAVAMGHYYFTNLAGEEVKVEYTLGFIKRGDDIKIWLQDSSLPYSP